MARSILLWILALLITLGSAYYQRTTGPTYPVDGSVAVGKTTVHFSLTRTHGGDGDQVVPFFADGETVQGALVYRRYKTDDSWTRTPLVAKGDSLFGALPHQPPAGKLEYFAELEQGESMQRLPAQETVVTRFKGAVPLGVLIPHVIAMFLAMLISARAGLEALRREGRPRIHMFVTIVLLLIGGFIFGPIVQKYAFGEYWTGFPFGMDLTDNKTLIALIAWLVALAAIWKKDALQEHPTRRWLVFAASVVMLLIFLIPHSMMGSEIDYKEMDRIQAQESSVHENTGDEHGVPGGAEDVDTDHGAESPEIP